MFGAYVFDDNAATYGVTARDADYEVELMDGLPAFILNALMQCPDVMEGSRHCDAEETEEQTWEQALLVVVVDGEACEDGGKSVDVGLNVVL
ncbi:predicted protein [Pyrenophora tritici-repentis Pt-1C-BFP]|uniref:Uncharacterized protein n=2 Tax=Pyrenophora tritici-repentis TaxID=45151 RepID=B2WGP8_PYRTR|nr:uncharacterized protein PTRG_09104 [Pyrenophora tritici-repentis Pt-1C-BFP]EDU42155.1 predicted protein [Pyrenophora tritici-repentis Pt-1C-BFP]